MKVIQKNLIEILKKKNFSLATENLLAQCKTEKVSLMAWRLASSFDSITNFNQKSCKRLSI